VESKWKNYHITNFLDSLSEKTLSLEEAMDLSRDRNEMNDIRERNLVTSKARDTIVTNLYREGCIRNTQQQLGTWKTSKHLLEDRENKENLCRNDQKADVHLNNIYCRFNSCITDNIKRPTV
jgi:hypothetical protein